jgi:hypothetical protein
MQAKGGLYLRQLLPGRDVCLQTTPKLTATINGYAVQMQVRAIPYHAAVRRPVPCSSGVRYRARLL